MADVSVRKLLVGLVLLEGCLKATGLLGGGARVDGLQVVAASDRVLVGAHHLGRLVVELLIVFVLAKGLAHGGFLRRFLGLHAHLDVLVVFKLAVLRLGLFTAGLARVREVGAVVHFATHHIAVVLAGVEAALAQAIDVVHELTNVLLALLR